MKKLFLLFLTVSVFSVYSKDDSNGQANINEVTLIHDKLGVDVDMVKASINVDLIEAINNIKAMEIQKKLNSPLLLWKLSRLMVIFTQARTN
ncbi:hypothetical protein [Sphingobacterium kyonggiense]